MIDWPCADLDVQQNQRHGEYRGIILLPYIGMHALLRIVVIAFFSYK